MPSQLQLLACLELTLRFAAQPLFSYLEPTPTGPSQWGSLFPTCSLSYAVQSPIDISQATSDSTVVSPLFYTTGSGCTTWTQGANTSLFYVDFTLPAYKCTNLAMTFKQQSYILSKLTFHSPSEHTFGGGYFDGEVQLWHQNPSTGNWAAVSILFQVDPANLKSVNNTFLKQIWNSQGMSELVQIQSMVVPTTQSLKPYQYFLPGSRRHYQYTGSSTQPPCIGNVAWFVFAEPITISSFDLSIIRGAPKRVSGNILSASGDNNRPEQRNLLPVNVMYYSGSSGSSSGTGSTSTGSTNSDSGSTVLGFFAFLFAMFGCSLALYLHFKFKAYFEIGPHGEHAAERSTRDGHVELSTTENVSPLHSS